MVRLMAIQPASKLIECHEANKGTATNVNLLPTVIMAHGVGHAAWRWKSKSIRTFAGLA
jgi:hypothetical protein